MTRGLLEGKNPVGHGQPEQGNNRELKFPVNRGGADIVFPAYGPGTDNREARLPAKTEIALE